MILDRAIEAGGRGSLCLHPAVNSFKCPRSRFYRLVFYNLGIRGLLTLLPKRQTLVYHGLESRE
jgi:hypothetical protein